MLLVLRGCPACSFFPSRLKNKSFLQSAESLGGYNSLGSAAQGLMVVGLKELLQAGLHPKRPTVPRISPGLARLGVRAEKSQEPWLQRLRSGEMGLPCLWAARAAGGGAPCPRAAKHPARGWAPASRNGGAPFKMLINARAEHVLAVRF